MNAVAGIRDDHLVASWGEVCPERRRADGNGVGGSDGYGVELVGLCVDDADGAVGLVEDEGTSAVGGHDAVDGICSDGDGGWIDGVACGLDGGDLAETATFALTDGVDARCAGNAGDVDRCEGRIDAKILLEDERLAGEL